MLLNRIDLRLRYYTGSGSTIYCDIYAVDGSHFPTGGSLAQASIAGFANPVWDWKSFVFGSPPNLTIGVEYAAVLSSPASSSTLTYEISFDHNGPYAEGGQVRYTTFWAWYAQNDCCFKAYSDGDIQIQITEGCVSLSRWGKTTKIGMTFAFPSDDPPTAPSSLLCNAQSNPVDVLPAYFSAIYNDPNFGDIADYYRLQVNKLSDFTGQMLWDSGKTAMSNVNEGDRCSNIDYNGQALSLNKIQYYWRIKFWDDEGNEGVWSAIGATHFTMAGSGAGEMGAGPWEEDVLYAPSGGPWNGAFGIGEVEIPRRSGNWTTLADMMRIHTSVNKNPLDAIEIAQAEVTACNISKSFNSFEEASDWYKQLEGFAVRLTVACMVAGSPVSRRLFTGIISSVDTRRSSQTAEMKIVDFLDYFGRVTIEQTPVWENISLTQLYKNLVELAFSDWVEGVDYFVEDLGAITVQAISYENLNLLAELKHIAECRGMRIFTDVNGKLVCRSRSMEGDAWDIKHDYNLEDVSERRDIDNVYNWIVVHARPHEVAYEPVETFEIVGSDYPTYVPTMGPDVTPSGKVAGFTATPGFEKIDLSWWNPTGSDFSLTRVRGSVHGYPVNIDDGVQCCDKGGAPGSQQFDTRQPLTTPSRRYYSAFVQDTAGNWSEAAHCSACPGVGGDTWVDDTGTSPVSAFSGTPGSGQISLTWRNPDVNNFELVRIRRSTSTYPATPSSGSAVYEGTAETKLDTGLTNGTRYYYSAFAKNTAGKWSRATYGTCIPGGIKKAIGSQVILGGGCLRRYNLTGQLQVYPACYYAGSEFSMYKDLRFGSGGQTADWLRFKHRWDITVDSSSAYVSNQKHEVGEEANLALSFSKTIGGILAVTVTKVGLTSTSVRVRYSARYIGGQAYKISFRNTLILMG